MNQIIGIQLVLVVWMPLPAPGGGQQDCPWQWAKDESCDFSLMFMAWWEALLVELSPCGRSHGIIQSCSQQPVNVVIKVLIVLSYNDRRALHWQSMLEITDHQLSCS